MSDYRIGQVIYVVLKKQALVFPVQVVEVVHKQTREGTQVSYVVRARFTDGERQVQLSELDGEAFDTADQVKRVLTERTIARFSKMVDAAATKAREWYDGAFEAPGIAAGPDDVAASVAIRSAAPGKRPPPVHSSEVQQLAAELEAEAQASAAVVLPDGTTAKVRSVSVSPTRPG